jgi:hypothetical protein
MANKIPIEKKSHSNSSIVKQTNLIEIKSSLRTESEWESIIQDIVTKEILLFGKEPKVKYYDRVLKMANFYQDKTHEFKILQMIAGKSWQKLMGYCPGWTDLGEGHPSKLDLETENQIMELKNRYNTLNSKSKANVIDCFVEYKKLHPKCQTILSCINALTKEGEDRILSAKGIEYRLLTGDCLLKFMFGDQMEFIETCLREEIYKQWQQSLGTNQL